VSSLRTRAEATHYRETSLRADVMAFLAGLQANGDATFVVSDFGTSVQGRALPLLVLSEGGVTTPEQARALGRPIVLMPDGIHPGEVEGKAAKSSAGSRRRHSAASPMRRRRGRCSRRRGYGQRRHALDPRRRHRRSGESVEHRGLRRRHRHRRWHRDHRRSAVR